RRSPEHLPSRSGGARERESVPIGMKAVSFQASNKCRRSSNDQSNEAWNAHSFGCYWPTDASEIRPGRRRDKSPVGPPIQRSEMRGWQYDFQNHYLFSDVSAFPLPRSQGGRPTFTVDTSPNEVIRQIQSHICL